MDNHEIVRNYFDNVNAGKWDEYLALFDDKIVMDEQLMGHVEGIEHVRQSIEMLKAAPKFQNHLKVMVVEGDKAMARWHISTLGPKGEAIEADGVNYYEFKNGKIVYFSNYHDTKPFQPVLDAMGR
jgi:ketosteroid isomerase-like protein